MKERKYLLDKEKNSSITMYVIGFIIIAIFVALFSLSGSHAKQNTNTNNINNNDVTNTHDVINTPGELAIKSIVYEPESATTIDNVKITVILENKDVKDTDYTLIIKYGDTGATGVSGAANEPKTHIFNHVYTNEGTYTIKASLKINDEIRSELTKDIVIS